MGYQFDNFVYVHIPKTAGTFIIRNLQNNDRAKRDVSRFEGQHRPMWLLEKLIRTELGRDIRTMYSFATVRNPWSRMYSCYQWARKYKLQFPQYFTGTELIDSDFNNWIKFIYCKSFDRNLYVGETNLWKYWFTNQCNYFMTEDLQHKYKVNKVIRVEDFYTELVPFFQNVLKFNAPDVNSRVNMSADRQHYSKVYKTRSIDLVGEHFSEDIKYFDYSYEDKS